MLTEYLLTALFEEVQSQSIGLLARTSTAVWELAKSENRSKECQNPV